MCRQPVEPTALFEAPDVPAEDADDDEENGGGNDRDDDGMLVKPAQVRTLAPPAVKTDLARKADSRWRRVAGSGGGRGQVVNPSSKIIALLEYLENARKRDPKIKSIVFSQWTRMLDLIDVRSQALRAAQWAGRLTVRSGRTAWGNRPHQSALQSSNFQSCRLDGTMSRKNRDRAIEYGGRARARRPACAHRSRCALLLSRGRQDTRDGPERHGHARLAHLRQPGPQPGRRLPSLCGASSYREMGTWAGRSDTCVARTRAHRWIRGGIRYRSARTFAAPTHPPPTRKSVC